jgi:large subunit ribosomal protein L16|uniref:Ribosomal protein L16 n=1 Tax=Vermamoeba vermiformis TaxID=5778 RepID=D4PBJ3_VERVE|nr:ribosomal protein L16 [Vermamoeba vermiformis]ADD62205.1 ribosomal protein L16 [Vermamoeba vermiformis]
MKTNPQNLKFKKYHKPSISLDKNNVNFKLRFGSLGLQTTSSGPLTFSQIESGRKALRRVLKKTGFLWVRVFPYSPLTKKPLSVRMGKGKGPVNSWVCVTSAGQIVYELKNISFSLAKHAIRSAVKKLPIKGGLIKKVF